MTDTQNELEGFITWFVSLEDIPAQSRAHFIDHVLEVGTIDEKAEKFISQILNHLAEVSQKEADNLKNRLDSLQAAIAGEKIPEISMKEKIIRSAGEDMNALVDDFRADYQAAKAEVRESEETAEQSEEEAEVEQIKENL